MTKDGDLNCGRLLYSRKEGDGYVALNPSFQREPSTVRLDCLQDWIADLVRIYNKTHKEVLSINKRRRKGL